MISEDFLLLFRSFSFMWKAAIHYSLLFEASKIYRLWALYHSFSSCSFRSNVKPCPRTSLIWVTVIKALGSIDWINSLAAYSFRGGITQSTPFCCCWAQPVSTIIIVTPALSVTKSFCRISSNWLEITKIWIWDWPSSITRLRVMVSTTSNTIPYKICSESENRACPPRIKKSVR